MAFSSKTEAVSKRKSQNGAGCLALFFLVFLLMGGGMFFFMFVRPGFQMLQAKSWTPATARILSSNVSSSTDSDGDTTYGVDISYEYSYNGRTYQNDDYDALFAKSSGYEGKAAIVARYPVGSTAMCYVNPGDPTQAFISTQFRTDFWFGLIPLVFFAIGLGGMIWALRSMLNGGRGGKNSHLPYTGWQPSAAKTAFAPSVPITSNDAFASRESLNYSGGPVVLKPNTSRAGKFIGMVLIAIFWNGIVSVFLYQLWSQWNRGGGIEWFLAIFLIPFVLVGLGFIVGIFNYFLALFAPSTKLVANSVEISPGGVLELSWKTGGGLVQMRRLHIFLEAQEQATYRRGTDTYTDRSTFYKTTVADVNDASIANGNVSFTLPRGLMHSFEAPNNKIIWSLKVQGDIPLWPNVDDEYKIVILPETVS